MWFSIVNSHTFLGSYSGKQGWHVQEGTSKLLIYEVWRKLICSRQFGGSMIRESEKQGCRWQYEKEEASHTDVWFISCFKNVHNSNMSSFCLRLQLEKLSSEFILPWNLKQCNPQQSDENCGKESVAANTEYKCLCLSESHKHFIQEKESAQTQDNLPP